MNIDHICIAVKDIKEGLNYWQDVFGYIQMTEPVVNTKQKVRVVFLKKENSVLVKLIEPLEDNLSLNNFVKRGGGFHHICFKCDDIDEKLAELKGKGLLSLVPPQAGEAFGGHDIAFLLAKNGLNIELIDTDIKAGLR
ncbi:VOC family protein [Saccharicrinis fermentans]|uniref:4-hydroxyphenylpyruvate dioxygenase n=1 Tax=Saccharicrinis fermentans DSM 9555 = JCM 21142 TaxID=869213 RepID=W7YLH6_9BACT|nr:VOC family protein [Saccharicrinis fermentans]GAF03234.1 4-hydroxyphenylpyruvate dioxygenase [Saccharicrinis fermentans DSM 9555 = JCM 21142]